MIDQQMQARHLLHLSNIDKILKEKNIQCQIIEASQNIPMNMLLVAFNKDAKNRDQYLTCSFIPMAEDDLKNSALLQIYSEFPFEIDSRKIPELLSYLNEINLIQMLGHFGLKDKTTVYFKYIYAFAQYEEIPEDQIIEVIYLIEYAFLVYKRTIEDILSGTQDLNEAISALNR